MMIGRFAIALLAAFALPAAASEPREANDAGFRYLVFETAGAKPDAVLPMIVGLHYSSANPEAMLEYFDGIDFPVRIVLPQGEYPRRGGYSWFASDYADLNAAEQKKTTFAVEEKLSDFVGSATARYRTRGKPIAMGISYGGDLSFLLAIRHPEQFRAAFPVAARFLPSWMPASNRCKPNCPPIRAMHGDADTTVPMAPTQNAVQQLVKMGYDVRLTPYSGVTHDFDARMESDLGQQVKALLAADPVKR